MNSSARQVGCSLTFMSDEEGQADKQAFLPLLESMENWLYDEEAEVTRCNPKRLELTCAKAANKSTFVAKLDELKKFGDPAGQPGNARPCQV